MCGTISKSPIERTNFAQSLCHFAKPLIVHLCGCIFGVCFFCLTLRVFNTDLIAHWNSASKQIENEVYSIISNAISSKTDNITIIASKIATIELGIEESKKNLAEDEGQLPYLLKVMPVWKKIESVVGLAEEVKIEKGALKKLRQEKYAKLKTA